MESLIFEKIVLDPSVEGPVFEVGDVNGDGKTDLILSSFGLIEGTSLIPGQSMFIWVVMNSDPLKSKR